MKMFIKCLIVASTILISCKKDSMADLQTPEETVIPGKDSTTVSTPIIGNYRTIDVGTGSGNLIIDGSKLTLKCNDHIRITKGSYKSISIKNIQSADGCTIVVTNSGLVQIDGDFNQMTLSNLKGVTISGDGDASIKYGFQFHDNIYRAVTISDSYNRCTMQYLSFKNIKDYVITFASTLVYDETPSSYSQDLKFLNISCENTSSFLQFSGSVENGNVVGLVKNLEIANLNFINSSTVGTMIWIGCVDGYDVHNNRVDNINSANNNHNGIFHLTGNGKFHDNFVSNHQGNALRAWTFSLGSRPKEVLIYNNIVVNSRKYSAFETQSFANFVSNKATYANTKVYNNTCGNLNLEKNWYANVVDVYNLQGGTCKVFNNIGFNFPASNPNDKISNQQSSTAPQNSNNIYFASISDVGFADKDKFTLKSNSIAKNEGTAISTLLRDYYATIRSSNKPSIGAVE